MLQRTSARTITLLYACDIILTVGALYLARWLRVALPYGRIIDAEGLALPAPMILLTAIIWSLTLVSFKVYDLRRMAHPVDEAQATLAAIAVATFILAGVLFFSYRGLSRLLYVYFVALDAAFLLAARRVLPRLARGAQGAAHRRALIIGGGPVGQQVAAALAPMAALGLGVVGYLHDGPEPDAAMGILPRLGGTADVRRVVADHGVHEAIIALPLEAHDRVAALARSLQDLPVNVKVVPDYSDLALLRARPEQLGDLLLIGLQEPIIGPLDRAVKRGFDIMVATLALLLLAPMLGVIALAVAITSPGPVFYGSRRAGEGGRPFTMFKYRTMVRGADTSEGDLVAATADGRTTFAKRPDDPRVTRVGRFLRRWSLDELPQLFNVLRGEMSLVGPRPELPALVERYEAWQCKRFSVPQGITGWWQISGRAGKAKHLHVEDDLYYIRNYSLLLDLYILWRTVGATLKGEGAF
jgi:exopolysaccharide biosynthesis polyprenyl glycosylphosphotransferase